jgi:hypothetical protein
VKATPPSKGRLSTDPDVRAKRLVCPAALLSVPNGTVRVEKANVFAVGVEDTTQAPFGVSTTFVDCDVRATGAPIVPTVCEALTV